MTLTKINWSKWVPVIVLILIVIGFSFTNDAFFTQRNLTNLTRQVSVNCILAFGMTIIILLGGIDLGIGSLVALGSVVAALLQVDAGFNQMGLGGALVTMVTVLLTCSAVGAFTGGLVAKFRMPPFVVTLGILVIARGFAMILSGGSKISPLSSTYRWIGTAYVPESFATILLLFLGIGVSTLILRQKFSLGPNELVPKPIRLLILWGILALSFWIIQYRGLPMPVLLTGLVFGVIYFLLNHTTFGRAVYAIGGNPEAARLCGIRVPLVLFLAFTLMGFLVGLASMIEGTRIDAGDPNAGQLYELDAIAAVVIGGTSLQGGIGTLQGTLLGAVLMGTVNNGMSLMNIPTHYQMVIKGGIIILAVLMDVTSKNKG